GVLSTFPHAEGYVKNNAGQYIYHYIYRDHLGNNRLVYADLDGNGIINPATEIVEESNYYPFGLKHEGYNEVPGDGYKYKFLNKEYEDSFALNVTETDYRQYDAALGRFNVIDMLSEMAPDHTPYRYGFNNPVFWQDASGLFETEEQARNFALENGIKNYKLTFDSESRSYTLTIIGGEFDGRSFYDFSELLPDVLVGQNGDGSGGSGASTSNNAKSNSNNGFWKFWEAGGIVNAWGVMRDMPGFKMNSRKRSAVDFSINYDEFYSRSAGSSMRF